MFARIFFSLFLIVFFALPAFPNAAQPGFWGAGGTGTFSLLYPEDSASYKKIQMVREKVNIQLYRGFAVIKGEYWMYNETPETVSIRVGYPLNAHYQSQTASHVYLEEIRFDSLYGLQAFVDGQAASILARPADNPYNDWENNNWYVWTTAFTPGDTTRIEVYFVVNTNDTKITEGYNKDHRNGFIYLLETGATWKQPIIEGEIRIQLMDDLTTETIRGIAPDSIFGMNPDGKMLRTQFTNLSPTGNNNIVIAYGKQVEGFEFERALSAQEELYANIDAFASEDIEDRPFTPIRFESPFDVESSTGGWFFSFMMILAVFAGPAMILFGVILAAYVIVRALRKRRQAS